MIKRDLDRRKIKNSEQMEAKRAIERFVLDLGIDWETSITGCLRH